MYCLIKGLIQPKNLNLKNRQRNQLLVLIVMVFVACKFTEYKENIIDWDEREKELIELCDRHDLKMEVTIVLSR